MKLIIANLKMNLTLDEILNYKKFIAKKYSNLIICPSNIYIRDMISQNYYVGSQDGFYIDSGAFTGETSFEQLSTIGVKYSIIGHSERRHKFMENNDLINKKYNSCIRNGITPILCVGETKEERDSGNVFEALKVQIESVDLKEKTILAYEPVWAIGTKVTPTLEEIEEVHKYINNLTQNKYKVLYGGSVSMTNIKEFSKSNHIDGFLIGSASLDPKNLINMINETM